MPELAEVNRIVHFIREHLVGKKLAKVQAQHDDIIYGKVGTSAAEFQKAMEGKTVAGAGQQGKYFWITMSSPPHVVMHFGMSGWLKIKNADTYYYRSTKPEDKEWPPKYWKFMLTTDEDPATEAAFVDARRLGRIRLVDCPADQIRNFTPLKENGPDPVADKDTVTAEWLSKLLVRKKVPVKALLLDQANISGIGNWMGDEILYHAKVHPEQYSNTLSQGQIKQLTESIHYVCSTSVEVLADSEQFPDHWLFKHRWGKGKKDASSSLPNGEKIIFVKVGGRTSAVVPSVQKKSGQMTAGLKEEEPDEGEDKTPKSKSRGRAVKDESDEELDNEEPVKQGKKRGRPTKEETSSAKEKPARKVKLAKTAKSKAVKEEPAGRRRSARIGK